MPKRGDTPAAPAATGPVLAATRVALETLGAERSARGAIALNLAALLDAGAGMASAAVAKELRTLLADIEGGVIKHDDALTDFLAGLRAPVGDS